MILPYLNASAVLGSLAHVPDLKFVQTQSTGYDGVPEAAGPAAAVATASGVHAAATAELAVGLILAKLRGIDQAVKDPQLDSWKPAPPVPTLTGRSTRPTTWWHWPRTTTSWFPSCP